MNEVKLIILLVIAHLLSDFVFQSQKLSDRKEKRIFTRHHIYHVLIVGILSYILSFDTGFWKAAIVLTFLHLLTDMLKSWLISRDMSKNYFFLDQIIHLVIIISIVYAYSYLSEINFYFEINLKLLLILTAYVFCTKPSNIIIKHLFISFSVDVPDSSLENVKETGLPNAGRLIGIVERFLALSLIIMGEFAAIGLIIAAKSILRFNATQKSEYVLVGTLLSFSMVIFWGLIISLIK